MTKPTDVKKGDAVEYKYGKAKVEAEISAVHKSDTEKAIKGKTIKRNGSKEDPAIEVKTKKGGMALKSASEVKVAK